MKEADERDGGRWGREWGREWGTKRRKGQKGGRERREKSYIRIPS